MSNQRVPTNADALGGMISSGAVIPKPDKIEVESALARSDDDRTLGDWNAIEEAARWALWALPDGANFADLADRHPLWLRLTGTKVMGGLPSPSIAGVDRYVNAASKPDAIAATDECVEHVASQMATALINEPPYDHMTEAERNRLRVLARWAIRATRWWDARVGEKAESCSQPR